MTESPSLDWLLDDLVARVPSARQAVVLSVDGLLTGSSSNMPIIEAEHLAAVAAGFSGSPGQPVGTFRGGAVRQTIVEMESASSSSPPPDTVPAMPC